MSIHKILVAELVLLVSFSLLLVMTVFVPTLIEKVMLKLKNNLDIRGSALDVVKDGHL